MYYIAVVKIIVKHSRIRLKYRMITTQLYYILCVLLGFRSGRVQSKRIYYDITYYLHIILFFLFWLTTVFNPQI